MPYNEIDALIQALGGATRVAEQFRITTQAVSNWISENEIPRAREVEMLQLVVAVEALESKIISWRPRGWDPRVELRFNPAKLTAIAA